MLENVSISASRWFRLAVLFAVGQVLLFSPSLMADDLLSRPVNVIFDTDIGPDCDDVGAVVLLNSLADQKKVNVLGMVCCTSSPWGVPCLDALNTYYGRPEIPLGTLKKKGFLDQQGYPEQVAKRFPHSLKSGNDAPDATVLYRQLLASQKDHDVVIVAVGPLPNIRYLLESLPDSYSSLSGKDLVAKKVSRLHCMGGRYPKAGRDAEWNFAQDIPSAKIVLDLWPTPITFSGGEVGSGVMTGRRVAIDCPEHNPLAFAYGVYVGYGRDRESWDLTSALVAGGPCDQLPVSESGTNSIDDQGCNTFQMDPAGRHCYLRKQEPVLPLENKLEDLLTSAASGPLSLDYDLVSFAKDGYGEVTAYGSEYGPETGAFAFDRSEGSVWYAGQGESWLQFKCADGRAYPVSRYTISAKSPDLQSWKLMASKDGGLTWVTLDSRTDEPMIADDRPRLFQFENAIPFGIYRICFPGDRRVHVAEVSLFERIVNRDGVAVTGLQIDNSSLRIPVSGRASLNVSVLPCDARNQQVDWTSSDPTVATVRRIGKNTAVVFALREGACRVTATSRDSGAVADSNVTVTPTTLPAGWVYEEINAPHVPGEAIYQDGVLTLTGGGMGLGRWWQRNWDQFALFSQSHEGDASISSVVASLSKTGPGSIAGLMFRETADVESRFVAIGIHPSGELIWTWRSSNGDENPRVNLGKVTFPIHLKLVRRGNSFLAYTSNDGVAWNRPIGEQIIESYARSSKVGICVTSSLNPSANTACFEQVRVDIEGKTP